MKLAIYAVALIFTLTFSILTLGFGGTSAVLLLMWCNNISRDWKKTRVRRGIRRSEETGDET